MRGETDGDEEGEDDSENAGRDNDSSTKKEGENSKDLRRIEVIAYYAGGVVFVLRAASWCLAFCLKASSIPRKLK